MWVYFFPRSNGGSEVAGGVSQEDLDARLSALRTDFQAHHARASGINMNMVR